MIRPQTARWIEIVTARDDAFAALEALAAAGCVEVETRAGEPSPSNPSAAALRAHAKLAERYQPYWPRPAARPAAVAARERRAPADVMATAVARLQAWATQAEPLIARLQQNETHAAELALTAQALNELRSSWIDLAQLARARAGVTAQVFALPLSAPIVAPADCLVRETLLAHDRLMLALGPPASIETLAKDVLEAGGRSARFPAWIGSSLEENLTQAAAQRAKIEAQLADLRSGLARLAQTHDLRHALGDIARAAWCFEHGGDVAMGDAARGDVFARITGWTIDPLRVVAALESSDARALARFPAPPRDAMPPLVLRNPRWARPFELFTRLVGMPAANSADPSVLLAFAVPLMFGYMFGDVGQGLVLVALGMLLGRRVPVLRLLLPAGAFASLFGVLFGAVFCSDALLRPLWVAPLAQPLRVLLIPIAFGAALLVLGMLVNLVEASWQRTLAHWGRVELPVLATYVGTLSLPLTENAWLLVAAGLTWAIVGGWFDAAPKRNALGGALGAFGRTVGSTAEVLINTLSFARVGAFALAHAGLASAVIALADASDRTPLRVLVIVLGNALILLLEGLVVSIQTTRLVLFEFFVRFFQARGRPFRPLAPPPIIVEES